MSQIWLTWTISAHVDVSRTPLSGWLAYAAGITDPDRRLPETHEARRRSA